MKIIKILTLVSFLAFGFSVSTYGAQLENPILLQIQNLTRWKNSTEAPAVQQSLGAILKPRRDYPRFVSFLEEMKQYTSLFRKSFLLLEAEANGFGGFFALVVFKNHPKVFSLWIYEIDKNVFELREITPLQVTLNKIIMSELEDKRVTPFWVTSSLR
jgi:hypothetical protein